MLILKNILSNFINESDNHYFDDITQQINSEIDHDVNLGLIELSIEELEIQELYDDFLSEDPEKTNKFYIKLRKNRDLIKHSFIIGKFIIGDVMEFAYFYKSAVLTFSGICIAIKKKSFVLPDMSLILRNVVIQTGMELNYSYFYNRAYSKSKFLDYKRKFFTFNKNKLYFIRDRLNRESQV